MTARYEVDLETDRVLFDGTWFSREELTARIQQMLSAGDFKITRLSEALESLAQTIAGARSLTLKLSEEQYAKLEAAAQKLGKPAHVAGRDLLLQALGGAAPVTTVAPPPVVLPSVVAPPVIASVTEEPPALTIAPKRKDPLPGAPPAVLTPVAAPSLKLPTEGAAKEEKSKQGGPGDGRKWFNRT